MEEGEEMPSSPETNSEIHRDGYTGLSRVPCHVVVQGRRSSSRRVSECFMDSLRFEGEN